MCDVNNLVIFLLFFPKVEYKYDKESMKGCVIPIVDDKITVLAQRNSEMNSDVSVDLTQKTIEVRCTKQI